MEEQRIGFYAGITFIVIAAILLLGNFMGDSTFPTILGILGVLAIGASKYCPLKGKKTQVVSDERRSVRSATKNVTGVTCQLVVGVNLLRLYHVRYCVALRKVEDISRLSQLYSLGADALTRPTQYCRHNPRRDSLPNLICISGVT